MEILIKNMEMPKNYPYRLTLHSDGHVEDHSGYSGHGHYQAIPVPTPIDYKTEADVLLKLWMDKIITDGEYNKIIERLNKAVVLEAST